MRASVYGLVCITLFLSIGVAGRCAPAARHPASGTVDVLMLSDLHFDPYFDPAKFAELRREPIGRWPAILSRADSEDRVAAFTRLQRDCAVRGTDSPWPLVVASLHEAKLREAAPLFVTVSGDLLAHGFICKFHQLDPAGTAAEASAFAAKTIAFITQQLHAAYPSTPMYFALGNNDSGCADYFETPGSAFLKSTLGSFAAGLTDAASRASLEASFPHFGDYSVTLPGPLHNTRLIVLQDIFQSAHYKECSGEGNAAFGAEQNAWLRKQLEEVRANGEQAWVMTHIPPGIDVYATYHRYLFAPGEACNVKQPLMFLANSELGETIADFGDVVRLALFAHSHMDEIKLLDGPRGAIPAKLVPSISPINGNDPSFLVAQVMPQTATIKDYEVYAAANGQGGGWNLEYRYSAVYQLPDFSGSSVAQLTSHLVDDKTGEDEVSRAYERYFLAGGGAFAALGLQRLWPAYSCSLREMDPKAFRQCMCPGAAHAPAPAAP